MHNFCAIFSLFLSSDFRKVLSAIEHFLNDLAFNNRDTLILIFHGTSFRPGCCIYRDSTIRKKAKESVSEAARGGRTFPPSPCRGGRPLSPVPSVVCFPVCRSQRNSGICRSQRITDFALSFAIEGQITNRKNAVAICITASYTKLEPR